MTAGRGAERKTVRAASSCAETGRLLWPYWAEPGRFASGTITRHVVVDSPTNLGEVGVHCFDLCDEREIAVCRGLPD